MEEENKNKPLTLWDDFKTALKIIFIAFCLITLFTPVGEYCSRCYYYNTSRSYFPVYTDKKLDSIPKPEYFKLPQDRSDPVSYAWADVAIQNGANPFVKKNSEKQKALAAPMQAWNNHRRRMRQILGY